MIGFTVYLCFVVSWFLHLPARIPALTGVRLDLILVIVTGVLALVSRREPESAPRPHLWWAVITLTAYFLVTVPLVEWPGSVLKLGLELWVKAVVFYFFTIRLVSTARRLQVFLLVFVLCQAFRVVEPVYLHVTTGYWGSFASMADWEFMNRLAGAPHDVVNPNGLAFVVLSVICFAHYLWTGNWVGRVAYLGILAVGLYALALTGSRSGMAGLVVVFGAIWLRSRHKVVLALVAVAVIAWATPRLSSDLLDRYLSLVDSSTKNAGTAASRVAHVRKGFSVAMRRPLFGHGVGTSREALANFAGVDQPAHNLYAEVAIELGLVGLLGFLGFMGVLAKDLWGHRREWRARARAPALERAGDALLLFFVMNLLFSLASYGLTSYEWYFLAGLTQVLTQLRTRPSESPEPAVNALDTTAAPQLASG